MNQQTAALSCRGLWKIFGSDAENQLKRTQNPSTNSELLDNLKAQGIVACADINLDIAAGEFFVLMGLSGSGKSTLMRCMSRLTEPTTGQLLLDGENFLAASGRALRDIRRQKMGMVFQHFGLFPHMTVLENVAFPLRVQRHSKSQREAKAREMIELVGLEERVSAFPHELSGGQKQRVGIARSLAVDPELWFLDEPFSALDPLIRWQMQSELLRLQTRFRKTIIFVTHDFMEAVRLADRIAIMKDGMIVQMGTPQEIVLSPANDYVSEFVKEVPRTRIIKTASLMETAPADASIQQLDTVTEDMTLEEALSQRAETGGALSVVDANGVHKGVITAQRLAEALRSEPRND